MMKTLLLFGCFVIAVALAIPAPKARIQGTALDPSFDWIGRALVPRRINTMADQLDVRLGRAEGLPTGFEGWLRRDYSGSEEDPWGNIYCRRVGRRSYTVGSMGADGQQGTEDDITVTRDLPRDR